MSFAVSRRRAGGACAAVALIACPFAARGQEPTGRPPPSPAGDPGALDPNSPMAPLPGLNLDWPDLAAPDAPLAQLPGEAPPPVVPEAAARRGIEATGEQRYGYALAGLGGLAGTQAQTIRDRFAGLSALEQGAGSPANVAQIDRRARQDAATLAELMRAYGYYDAAVEPSVAPVAAPGAEPRLIVTLTVTPGPLYHFASVELPGLAAAGAQAPLFASTFGVTAGEPVDAEKVDAGVAALKTALGKHGYAFAAVGEPKVVVDHRSHEASLVLPVTPGRPMRFGRFEVVGAPLFTARHIGHIARLEHGQIYDASLLEDLRRALIQTGLVAVVELTPVRTADPDVVDVAVRLERAPPRTIAATLGYGTGEGASIEVSWQNRNLLPPEGAVTFRGLLGTQEQLFSTILRRGNFHERDQVLTGQFAVDHTKRPAYEAKTLTIAGGIERETNIIWQKLWTYSYGGELVASDERDVIAATGQPRERTYFVGALPLSLAYDGTDDLLNPTHGYRVAIHLSPEASFHGRSFVYLRSQLDVSAYQPVADWVVLAGRIRLASIAGASRDEIAPSRRYYVGGGGSVRGYSYQAIGPRDIDNTPIGGTSLAEFGAEARFRLGDFGIVPFLDGGNLYTTPLPRFTGFRYGAGIGARYYTSFGPVRLDIGTPLNPQKGDPRVTVYVSLGQAF